MSGPHSEQITASYAAVTKQPPRCKDWVRTYPQVAREYLSTHVSPEYAATLVSFIKRRVNGNNRPIEVQELDDQLRSYYLEKYPEIQAGGFDAWRAHTLHRINKILEERSKVACKLDFLAAAASVEMDKLQSRIRPARGDHCQPPIAVKEAGDEIMLQDGAGCKDHESLEVHGDEPRAETPVSLRPVSPPSQSSTKSEHENRGQRRRRIKRNYVKTVAFKIRSKEGGMELLKRLEQYITRPCDFLYKFNPHTEVVLYILVATFHGTTVEQLASGLEIHRAKILALTTQVTNLLQSQQQHVSCHVLHWRFMVAKRDVLRFDRAVALQEAYVVKLTGRQGGWQRIENNSKGGGDSLEDSSFEDDSDAGLWEEQGNSEFDGESVVANQAPGEAAVDDDRTSEMLDSAHIDQQVSDVAPKSNQDEMVDMVTFCVQCGGHAQFTSVEMLRDAASPRGIVTPAAVEASSYASFAATQGQIFSNQELAKNPFAMIAVTGFREGSSTSAPSALAVFAMSVQ